MTLVPGETKLVAYLQTPADVQGQSESPRIHMAGGCTEDES